MELPQHTAALPGAVGNGTPAVDCCPPARGTGSPAQEAVAAYGECVGNGNPHWRGSTGSGDGQSCPGGGCCLWSPCGGRQPPLVRAHQLGGRGVLPRWRSLPMERLLGTVAPIGAGPLAGRTGSPAQEAVTASGALAGDGSPHGSDCLMGRTPRPPRWWAVANGGCRPP